MDVDEKSKVSCCVLSMTPHSVTVCGSVDTVAGKTTRKRQMTL